MELSELSEIQFIFSADLAWPCFIIPPPLSSLGGKKVESQLKY